ncbi:MAG: hypothetical protein R3195_10020 [Gemmatimonadota bacterium]|nr:hypothetical protein [Gemmatimonadota bacterium]
MSRRFDEREVTEILRRATEPRPGTSVPSRTGSDGLTLDEVKEVAAEAGIDPSRIEEAVNALARPAEKSTLDAFLGTPINVRFEADYDVALDEEGRREAVRLIRATLGTQGVVGGHGEDLEWMEQDGFGARNVNLYRTSRGTRVEIIGRFREAGSGAAGITGVTGAMGGGVAVAMMMASPVTLGLTLIPVTLGAMYAIPRLTVGRTVRRETRRLAELSDRLREALASRALAEDAAATRGRLEMGGREESEEGESG